MHMPTVELNNELQIFYELNGNPSGMPVILIHGHGSRGSTFSDIIPYLSDEFNLLTFDLRGHGASDKPLQSTYEETLPYYTIEVFVDDLCELIDAISFPTPFILVGHSMGGMIAQEFALAHPTLVSHLVLAGTAPSWYSEGRIGVLEHLKNGSFPLEVSFFRESCRMALTRAFRKTHPEVIESSIQSRILVPPDAYIGSMENLIYAFDTRDRLFRISMPTLILVGEQDAMVSPAQSKEMNDLISNSKLVIIPNQNHGIFHEVPELVATELKNFIRETA
jgi:pimeloyl-ACP methyl ester carboxylesterase